MLKKWFVISFVFNTIFSFAQNGIGYFSDYTNGFHIFDQGVDRQLETDRVSNIQVGNDYLVYTDPKKSLMCYYNGSKQMMEENQPTKMMAGANFFVYQMQQRLMLCEKGEKKLLSRNADSFIVGDSIVIWQNLPGMALMVYENGEIKTIAYPSNSNTVNDQKVGSNIWAYTDAAYMLNIYYKDSIYNTENSRITDYACGHNIVAFTDQYKNTFNVFYAGELKVLSNEIIKEFMVSNDMVAYIDAQENFYIFYKGGITKIDSRRPDFYYTKGNLLCFSYNSSMKIVYNGKIFTEPELVDKSSLRFSDNAMLYYNNVNQPKYYYKGKVNDHFYVPKPYTMELNRDLPVFRYGNTIGFLNSNKMFEFGNRAN